MLYINGHFTLHGITVSAIAQFDLEVQCSDSKYHLVTQNQQHLHKEQKFIPPQRPACLFPLATMPALIRK